MESDVPIYINTDFRGHWPVGTAAVVTADTPERAAQLLEVALAARGLIQPVKAEDMRMYGPKHESVEILLDGDY
jgi:hypothetical protein